MTDPSTPVPSDPTHICLDCGALGHAGGYHEHGGGEAGDTCSIEELRTAYIGIVQRLESEAEDRVAEAAAEARAATLCEVEAFVRERASMYSSGLPHGETARHTTLRAADAIATHFNPEANDARD